MTDEELKNIVKEKYGKIAGQSIGEGSSCCSSSCCGPETSYTVFSESYEKRKGYNPDADMNLGCGIPTDHAAIKNGDHVLDLGSGAGNDCFVARAIVGDAGRVTGLDMTEPMILKARENCRKLGYNNVEFVPGDIEQMPFESNRFDVVISNCVLNLVPDKHKAFCEIFRVLKPGGHFCVSDVVIKGNLPEKLKNDAEMFAGCVSGAIDMEHYINIIKEKGFSKITIHKQKEIRLPDHILAEYFSEDETGIFHAAEQGIYSITVTGNKN